MTTRALEPVFWTALASLNTGSQELDQATLQDRITTLTAQCYTGSGELDAARMELVKGAAHRLGLDLKQPPLPALPLELSLGPLPPITPDGLPGVSLVTCCMNREANLLKALDSWLACADLREIIIVDWSSDTPVKDALHSRGINDPRVRVIRVEGEPRWILSFAFNVGFRVASCSRILKVDADILLTPDFFQKNRLDKETFIAGNWRTATKDQAHINGFFYAHKASLAAIAGFNEYITTYGWDDDDIYARMTGHGLQRRDVAPDCIHHLGHDDTSRLGNLPDTGTEASTTPATALQELQRNPLFEIRKNRFLASVMPEWGTNRRLLPLEVLHSAFRSATVKRKGWLPHPVPEWIREDAHNYILLEMACWHLGQRGFELSKEQLLILLEKPLNTLGRLDTALILQGYDTVLLDGALVAVIAAKFDAQDIARLEALARDRGLTLILSGQSQTLPKNSPQAALAHPYLPIWLDLGALTAIPLSDLATSLERGPRQHFKLILNQTALTTLKETSTATLTTPAPPPECPAAPTLQPSRPRIFIDAQHGLGNRLRAIGSAAAVAERSGRELVIVWQPDAHCNCRFSDLFDYEGAVIKESFTKEAVGQGCRVYNYMEVEEGAEKNAPIDAKGSANLYARAAFVLNSPLSDWNFEKAFLQSLRPVSTVRDMVASIRNPNDVSAHVRMAGGNDYEHLAYEKPDGNWTDEDHQSIAQWRGKSHFSHFFKRIDALSAEGRADRIFLAADMPETYAAFKTLYGDRVTFLGRAVYDRSAEQLRYALADAILLGSSPLLLGSSWSSFSELAMRLSPQKMTVELSGKDF